jgi:hypothetical protein
VPETCQHCEQADATMTLSDEMPVCEKCWHHYVDCGGCKRPVLLDETITVDTRDGPIAVCQACYGPAEDY